MHFEVFEGFIDGIIVCESNLKVSFLNSNAVSVLQLRNPKELLNKNLIESYKEFAELDLSTVQDDIIFKELTIPSKRGLQNIVILTGFKKIPGTDNILLYLKDATTEVILHKKFIQEKREREKAISSAETDALTGCLNKAAFYDRLNTKFANLRSSNCDPACLLVLDLDGFKLINDNHGHQAGDAFLQKISDVIKNCLRLHDVLARFGGDEFVIMLTDCPEIDSITVARRILARIRNFAMPLNGSNLAVTASIGICGYDFRIETAENFFELADKSAYRAKNSGKNSICVHPDKGPYT